jgi:hypothetical protein
VPRQGSGTPLEQLLAQMREVTERMRAQSPHMRTYEEQQRIFEEVRRQEAHQLEQQTMGPIVGALVVISGPVYARDQAQVSQIVLVG